MEGHTGYRRPRSGTHSRSRARLISQQRCWTEVIFRAGPRFLAGHATVAVVPHSCEVGVAETTVPFRMHPWSSANATPTTM
jgi:hypothetical protein